MYTETATAVSVALSALEHRQLIFRASAKLRSLMRHGYIRIVIFGAGGSGKTTLGQLLAGNTDSSLLTQPYRESSGIEYYGISGDLWGRIIVPPGQKRRAETSWPKLYRLLSRGKSRGVINVVSWGYNFFELDYTETEYYAAGMTLDDFRAVYLKDQRARELEVLAEIRNRIIDAPKLDWMLTLVTKQDLWWQERLEVRRHYEDGPYGEVINQITSARGAANFRHELCSVSLVLHNMPARADETLVPTTAGYDQALQVANLQRLFEVLDSLYRRGQ